MVASHLVDSVALTPYNVTLLCNPVTPLETIMNVKFDAVIGYWQTRILHGVTREILDAYCATHGLRIASEEVIGLVYREVLLVKI